ncbi:hypothetical protein, partial [Enterococcus faecalis]|uniref:hypothetical protein n=1 Tax=Enterococcus faecalis TaxID=1351 RepID=UPI003CC55E96
VRNRAEWHRLSDPILAASKVRPNCRAASVTDPDQYLFPGESLPEYGERQYAQPWSHAPGHVRPAPGNRDPTLSLQRGLTAHRAGRTA